MNCRGTEPPTTLSTNSKPEPSGSGSTSMSQTANWPCPPDCLTCLPCPLAEPPKVSRSGTRRSILSTLTPNRLANPSSTTPACASPMHHSTIWWVSGFCSIRSVGSSAAKSLQADRQFVVVGLGVRLHRDRQQRLGHGPRLEHERIGLVGQRVSGFGAGQPADRADVTRHHGARRSLLLAERERQRADSLVLVVILVAGRRSRCFGRNRRRMRNGPTREPSRRA